MKPRGIFSITEFTNPSGATAYRVTGTKQNGDRVRENYGTKEEAAGRKQELEIEALNLPAAPDLKRTKLTQEQIDEAEMVFAALKGKSLLPVWQYYQENYREPVKRITVTDAHAEYIADIEKRNRRPLTIKNIKQRLTWLLTNHGKRFVCDITSEILRDFLFRAAAGPVCRENDRKIFTGFFNWSTKRGYCLKNPTDALEPVKLDRHEPVIFSLEACRKFMTCAEQFKDGALVPYSALALFAAIRPAELARLTWRDIDLDAKTVTISAAIAKKRRRRIVELSDNCLAWLMPHAVKKTPIKGLNWTRDFDGIKRQAGYGNPELDKSLKPWTPDVLRHTGISYHLATYQHEGKTAQWAGNSPDIVQTHYKGLVKPADVKEFWAIVPDTEKVVSLRKAA